LFAHFLLLDHLATDHFGGFWFYNALVPFRITVVPISELRTVQSSGMSLLSSTLSLGLVETVFFVANQQPFPFIEAMQISIFTGIYEDSPEALLMIPQVYSYHI